jgi:hypothetical protein
MPRYFFNLCDGRDFPDEEGSELDNADSARSEAVVLAGELLRDLGGRFWQGEEWRLHVTDEGGETVCALRFMAEHT